MDRLASTYKYAVRVFDPNIGYPPIDGIVSEFPHRIQELMTHLTSGLAVWEDQGEIAWPTGGLYNRNEVQGICNFSS